MTKAIIIDDEQKLIEVLKFKLQQNFSQIEIIGEAKRAGQGYELINQLKPDLVFLDIGLPDESGMDLLRKFDKIDFEIIFVTGYSNYALEAIKFCAIGYILKPIRTDELIDVVSRAIDRIQKKNDQ